MSRNVAGKSGAKLKVSENFLQIRFTAVADRQHNLVARTRRIRVPLGFVFANGFLWAGPPKEPSLIAGGTGNSSRSILRGLRLPATAEDKHSPPRSRRLTRSTLSTSLAHNGRPVFAMRPQLVDCGSNAPAVPVIYIPVCWRRAFTCPDVP